MDTVLLLVDPNNRLLVCALAKVFRAEIVLELVAGTTLTRVGEDRLSTARLFITDTDMVPSAIRGYNQTPLFSLVGVGGSTIRIYDKAARVDLGTRPSGIIIAGS